MKYVNENNTKSRPNGKYGEVIKRIQEDGVCPFCVDNIETYHKNPLERKKFWWVTDSMYPYSPTKHHRLLIHIQHINHAREITPEAWIEIKEILDEETSRLDISGGTMVMRFGETRFTGGSVSHLHVHITQSDPDHESYDPQKGVIMRIG
jgi:diadenosine tetraphosphate (Ap4A) HIT family hydrolase